MEIKPKSNKVLVRGRDTLTSKGQRVLEDIVAWVLSLLSLVGVSGDV